MGTKNNPGRFDCYASAEPNEPMFILLARDEKAPALVRQWVATRAMRDQSKANDAKAREALACAEAMETWQKERTGRVYLSACPAVGTRVCYETRVGSNILRGEVIQGIPGRFPREEGRVDVRWDGGHIGLPDWCDLWKEAP